MLEFNLDSNLLRARKSGKELLHMVTASNTCSLLCQSMILWYWIIVSKMSCGFCGCHQRIFSVYFWLCLSRIETNLVTFSERVDNDIGNCRSICWCSRWPSESRTFFFILIFESSSLDCFWRNTFKPKKRPGLVWCQRSPSTSWLNVYANLPVLTPKLVTFGSDNGLTLKALTNQCLCILGLE